jgi:single-strand selective monofunctional uracil DNA glycosylase
MEPSGKNLTPDKLPKEDRCRLEAVCDEFLSEVIRILDPEILVGVGKYAEKKLCTLIQRMDYPEDSAPKVTWVLHPSPASPTANRGWAEAATKQLIERGVWTG